MTLRAPFPWFGGKSRVADIVWSRFGDVPNYVEPFAGSLAVLLARPGEPRVETVNDLDCFIANFWRAIQSDPEAVAACADAPVNEADLHARHQWLVDRLDFREQMKRDPHYFDAKIAGWWVWGICSWIGGGWCRMRDQPHRTRPSLGTAGAGVQRRRPGLSRGCGVQRQLPDLGGDSGAVGRGIHASAMDERKGGIVAWFDQLAARLRRVRVVCGDWKRVLGPSPTTCIGTTAVFLDPPYSDAAGRSDRLYATDDLEVAHDVRAWALEHGDDPKLRIALCGYEGEHAMPPGWECVAWKAHGGYGGQGEGAGRENSNRERIWFSPRCLERDAAGRQSSLLDAL